MRHSEWHVTVGVGSDPWIWKEWCLANNIKPLWIELNNFNRQLMCAANFDPTELIRLYGWSIVRIKHEVSVDLVEVSTFSSPKQLAHAPVKGAIYYECHVKLNGTFQPQFQMTSRDLFRDHRWYATHRSERPFDPHFFADNFHRNHNKERSHMDSWEYEAALIDTNPGLDAGWC